MRASKLEAYQIHADALVRMKDKSLPLRVRISSRETVDLCEERMRDEGWKIPTRSIAA